MTIPRLNELTIYWDKNPPLQIMVQAYLGIEGKKDAAPALTDEGDFAEFLSGVPISNSKFQV